MLYIRHRRAHAYGTKAKIEKAVKYVPSKEEIELQPLTLQTMNAQVQLEPSTSSMVQKAPVTPGLLKRKLEKEFGVDFTSYDHKSQTRSPTRRQVDQLDSFI